MLEFGRKHVHTFRMTDKDEAPYAHEDSRLTALKQGLAAHPASDESKTTDQPDAEDEARSQGAARVLGELIGAPLGGVIIGFTIDHFAHTFPLFLLIFLVIGFAVGMWNIYKLAQSMNRD